MSFAFRAARLLAVRRTQADAARAAFVRASESAREAADVLAAAEARVGRAARDWQAAAAAPIDAGEHERHRVWIAREQGFAITSREASNERRLEAGTAAAALQEAARRVRILERLKDRAWRRHEEASRRAEARIIDALATAQFARRMVEGGLERDSRFDTGDDERGD